MDAIAAFARRLAFRAGLAALLDALALWLAAGLWCGAALVAAQRLLGFAAPPEALGGLPVLCGAFVGVVVGLSRWPGLHEAAVAADARFGLQERLSSALVATGGPMAELVRADALRHIEGLDLRSGAPVHMPRAWPALAAGALVFVAAALLPQMDIFGWRAARARDLRLVREATEAARVRLSQLQAQAGQGEIVRRVDRELAELLAKRASLDEALSKGTALQSEAQRALATTERRLAETTDPGRRAELEAERTAAAAASRVLRDWLDHLAGTATRPGQTQPARAGGAPELFVRPQQTPGRPPQLAHVGESLEGSRASAQAALRRGQVPWEYRDVVRRYFMVEDQAPATSQ